MGPEFRHKTPIALIVADPDPVFRRICREAIASTSNPNFRLLEAENADILAQTITNFSNAALLLDPSIFPDGSTSPISHVKNLGHRGSILVCTHDSSVDKAISLMRDGADNILTKPSDNDSIAVAISGLAPTSQQPTSPTPANFAGFVGQSKEMQSVYSRIQSIAKSAAPAFITGESGTGKELCAAAIHQHGARADKPLVALNCSAIPHDLMESEIFGHEKGAFTGAVADRPGAAELASGGTLFLDEICEMEASLQAKLLRFIQTGIIRRVGGSKDIKVDIRFICATNRDPLSEVRSGNFREDLYYRLHVVPIHLSPLRERVEDILPIAESYLKRCAHEEKSSFNSFSSDAAKMVHGIFDYSALLH